MSSQVVEHGGRLRLPVRPLLGLPCHALTMNELLEVSTEAVSSREPHVVMFVNAAKVVDARTDDELRSALKAADVAAADGVPVVWASKLLGVHLPERVAGIDYMTGVLELADARRWRVFFLGSTRDTLADLVEHVRRDHPGVVVAGTQHGYFDPAEDDAVAISIRQAAPDVLCVGMPSPRKELWLHRHAKGTGVPLSIAVGGSYDVLTGRVERAPQRWQRLGLEWLWRVRQEPRRLWRRYRRTNTKFLRMLLAEWLRSRARERARA